MHVSTGFGGRYSTRIGLIKICRVLCSLVGVDILSYHALFSLTVRTLLISLTCVSDVEPAFSYWPLSPICQGNSSDSSCNVVSRIAAWNHLCAPSAA